MSLFSSYVQLKNFINSTARGHTLTIKSADDQTLALTRFGEHLYDHLIVFAPGVDGWFNAHFPVTAFITGFAHF